MGDKEGVAVLVSGGCRAVVVWKAHISRDVAHHPAFAALHQTRRTTPAFSMKQSSMPCCMPSPAAVGFPTSSWSEDQHKLHTTLKLEACLLSNRMAIDARAPACERCKHVDQHMSRASDKPSLHASFWSYKNW